MHPAFSVIFLTTLIGAGQGLFLALFAGERYSVIMAMPIRDPEHFFSVGSAVSVVLLVAGLVSSFLHLGRPERAWRSAARWRTSWLSREVIALPLFIATVAFWGFIIHSGMNPVLFSLGGSEIDLSLMTGMAATFLCFALFVCTGMIYACIKTLQEWATPLTVVNYTLLGSASGVTLATAFAAVHEPGLASFFGGWAIALTAVALVTRAASLFRNARLKHKSTLETAIGIRHARIEQKSQGFMTGAFNTREFFHHAPRPLYRAVMWVFLVMVFALPLLLLPLGLGMHSTGLLVAAFFIQQTGMIAERWFFFAQANHPQNLYYQLT